MAAVQQRHNSFIKQVMEQVKKDMEADPKLKKDWDSAQKTSEKAAQRGATVEGRMEDLGETLKSTSEKTSAAFSRWREAANEKYAGASQKVNEAAEQNENLKKATEFMAAGAGTAKEGGSAVLGKSKGLFGGIMDKSSKVFSWVGDEDKKAEKTKQWKATREVMSKVQADRAAAAEAVAAEKAAAEGTADTATDKATAADADVGDGAKTKAKEAAMPPPEPEMALVVSEARNSSWDRFGTGLRDMPFLSSVFENPMFDRMFGESEIAASIREMKEVDYSFHLEEFTEDIEYVVAPHIIRTYLEGDQDALERHCGEAAFAAVNASIKARVTQKLSLDPAVLAGPRELQLVSAKLNDKGPPSFIWTFQMQQINCLRDSEGEVIEGAVDDIRNVCYAMAVERNIQAADLELEHPWQISELAILWNQPCI